MLKAQDILVLLKFLSPEEAARKTYAALGESLGLSAAECHGAVRRLAKSGLLLMSGLGRRDDLRSTRVFSPAASRFLCHGVPYLLPAEPGPLTCGFPTAEAAGPLVAMLAPFPGLPKVWKHPLGQTEGFQVEPIYPSAPDAALRDPVLGEWLSLIDAMRLSSGRIAGLAQKEIERRFRAEMHAAAA